MKYIYSNRDLLQNPEKYNFSKFEGIEFILSYFTSRQEIIQKAKLRIKDNLSLNDIIYNFFEKEVFEDTNDIVLENLFKKILCKQYQENESNLKIDVFLKKFEIKKKIYTIYNSDFSEKSNHYENLRNYLLLSFLCLKRYDETNNLKYLNTSLKLNDLLISQAEKISSQVDLTLLKINLDNELKIIQKICLIKGIDTQ